MSANVVIRIGRSRIDPASISASRSGRPSRSRAHLAKSISRIAFFATMPASRMMPIMLMMLMVCPATDSPSITPISESGSDIRIASGSRNDPNWTTRMKYINRIANTSEKMMLPKTSFCCSWSPAMEYVTPGGSVRVDTRLSASAMTSPVERPETFHSTVTTCSRLRWLITAGPIEGSMVATCPSGTAVAAPSGPATISGSCRRSSARLRDSGESRTTTSRVSPLGSCQSPASIPAKAGRSDCATCPTVMPMEPASPRFSWTLISGFWPLLVSDTSTALGTCSTSARICSVAALIAAISGPVMSSASCLRPPPQSLVNTEKSAPVSAAISSRTIAANSSMPWSRWSIGTTFTYTLPISTAPDAGSPRVV